MLSKGTTTLSEGTILVYPNYGHPKKVGFIFIVTVSNLSILCLRGVLELVAEVFSNISGRKKFKKSKWLFSTDQLMVQKSA